MSDWVGVVDRLHEGLDRRPPPEAVCALILELLKGQLLPAQRRLIYRAALSGPAVYSSMNDDFERPVAAVHKVRTLLMLLDVDNTLDRSEERIARLASDPWLLMAQLRIATGIVGWMPGVDPTAEKRLNREERDRIGIGASPRRYRKQVRQLRRTFRKAKALQEQVLLRQLVLVGRAGLAYKVSVEQMRADPHAAAFVAYWVAQRNRRRRFSLEGRENPFDAIAEALFSRCVTRGDDTDWWMIAQVYPVPEVLERLTDQQRGELMGTWASFMRLAADRMADLAAGWPDDFDRAQMVVRRGMDSSTWNTLALAYNAARAAWIGCVAASGGLALLKAVCPGKAMRLMAGDLAYLHRQSGSVTDPQTRVWAALPPPWEVLAGTATCTGRMVEIACGAAGVDARLTGWTGPVSFTQIAAWTPTPELVHGIEVADPLWAGLLRRAGAFSGKGVKPVFVP